MCEFLNVTKRQYYYKTQSKKLNSQMQEIENKIIKIFKSSNHIYGSRKISKTLEQEGIIYSKYKVLKVMKTYNLKSRYHIKKFRKYTKSNKQPIPNIVNREFSITNKKKILTSDLTYVKIENKVRYICFILNINTRQIVGFKLLNTKDAIGVYQTLKQSKINLNKVDIFHTDRGTEFVNFEIDRLLKKNNIKRSLSNPGCPYDNAVSESTFNIFKREFTFDKHESYEMFKIRLVKYVNWYNNIRIHSTLNYMTPNQYDLKFFCS